MTKEELEEQLQPLPEVDYIEFFSSDTRSVAHMFTGENGSFSDAFMMYNDFAGLMMKISYFFYYYSLYPHLFARAYLNFKNQDDIVLFRDRFDGYVFIDNRGLYTYLCPLYQYEC